MSVWREVQEALYARFDEAWKDGGEPVSPIQLGNETFEPPRSIWVQLLVQRRPGGVGTIGKPGDRKMDRAGSVFVLLREPPGNGVGAMSDYAERAAKVFENCRLAPHDIRFGPVEPGQEGDIQSGRWWGVTVEGRFEYTDIR